jgi:predicted ATPase/DNA-binding winged helix-turn-helix (wHTH) protein
MLRRDNTSNRGFLRNPCNPEKEETSRVTVLRFAEFELDARHRQLKKNGETIRLGSRAFDLLATLVAKANIVISKDDLIREVWPDTVVAEGALRVHLANLRKALGLGSPCPFIRYVPSQGYVFEASVKQYGLRTTVPQNGLSSLPAMNVRIVGRDAFIESCQLEPLGSVLTIVGPGGIGKTTVASRVAERLAPDFDEVLFVDLGALTGSGRVAVSLASNLGLTSFGDEPTPGIIRAIGDRRLLIFFDNCEHLIDEAAQVIEEVAAHCPSIRIITTSREPLRINAEIVKRLGPLAMPADDATEFDVAQSPAIELFLDRASLSMGEDWAKDLPDLRPIAEIVRKLDGIPLAIELAAARIVDLGISPLLSSLDSPLSVLRRGRRTAPPRQQTLRSTLDWSYNCLSADERELLMVLSVFPRAFTFEAAAAVACELQPEDVFDDALTGLLAKSLLSQRDAGGRLRLLETTREYASSKLDESSKASDVRAAHARYVRGRLTAAEQDWDQRSTSEWMSRHGDLIDDLRSALRWASATQQDSLFVDLAAHSGLVWTQLGLMGEQFLVVHEAIAMLEKQESNPGAETQLRSAYGAIAYNMHSVNGDEEAVRQFGLAAKAAELLGDPLKALRAYSGICAILTVQGRYEAADELAWRVDAGLGLAARPTTVRIAAHNAHYKGRHDDAVKFAREALDSNGARKKGTTTSGANFGQRLLALMVLAKTAWITGSSSEALGILRELLDEAAQIDHAVSSCLVLSVGAVPTFYGMGLLDDARSSLDRLRHLSESNSLFRWTEWADGYELFGFHRQGNLSGSPVTEDLVRGANGPRLENTVVVAGELAPVRLIDVALAGEAGWCKAELYRLKGLLRTRSGLEGREWIERGLELAREQNAVLWELRCAVSLLEMEIPSAREVSRKRVDAVLSKFKEDPPAPELAALSRAFMV